MGKLLTIETGFTCNSRCHYCTQLDYRVIPQADQLDLDTGQIRDRIAWAAEHDYDQIGFSGGEPTIRPDFVELVEFAREHGFGQIGVTTNGRMFAYRDFAEAAMRAGLNSFTFSLHGHTPALHDGITHAQGSLEQALRGLANIRWVQQRHGIRPHLMNNQILLPENTRHLKDVVAMLGPLGVGLFMVQPFIAQRSNVDDLGRFFVPYEEIVAAVAEAIPELARWGARVKPYNVPNCLLWPMGKEHVESQFYGITVYREFEQETAGEFRAFKAKQWYRIDQCKGCQEACPGFRIEQYPQHRMQAEVVEAAAQIEPGQRPTFAGTELLAPETLRTTLATLAAAHGPVAWLTAACERTPRPELAKLAVEAHEAGHLAELVLIAQPMDQRFLAQRVLEKGNLEELRQFLFLLAELRDAGRRLPPMRVLWNIGDLARLLDDPVLAGHLPALTKALARAAGDAPIDALVAVSNFPRDHEPPDMVRQRDDNLALAQRLREACHERGWRPRLLTLDDRRGLDPVRSAAMATVEAQLAEVLPVESWARRLFRHALAAPELDFVSWMPPWLFERWDLSQQPLPAGAVTRSAPRGRVALRQTSVAKTGR